MYAFGFGLSMVLVRLGADLMQVSWHDDRSVLGRCHGHVMEKLAS